jgi:hypothetical protein
MQAIYRCGCRADGDIVGLSCPMHGDRIVQTTWTDGGRHQPLPPPEDAQGDEIERLTKRVAELTATLERGIAVTLHSAVDRGIPIDIACRRLARALRDEYSAPGISRRDIAVVLDAIETLEPRP